MIPRLTAWRSILLAGTMGGLLVAGPVVAQQSPAATAPAAENSASPAPSTPATAPAESASKPADTPAASSPPAAKAAETPAAAASEPAPKAAEAPAAAPSMAAPKAAEAPATAPAEPKAAEAPAAPAPKAAETPAPAAAKAAETPAPAPAPKAAEAPAAAPSTPAAKAAETPAAAPPAPAPKAAEAPAPAPKAAETAAPAPKAAEMPAPPPAPKAAATPAAAPAPKAAAAPAKTAEAQPALPPGSPLIGRPLGNEAAAKLAPVAPPPIPAAADKLPTAKLKLPPGFHVEVYASGIANARSLRVGSKGTVFVGTRLGNKVTAVVKKDGKTELKTIASGLYRPNGLAYHNGTLYIAELSQISKIDDIENHLDNPPKPTVIYTDLPKDEAHGWKFIGIGPDNKLYIPVGQPGNNVLHDMDHGQIRRINLDGTGRETVALGVRNSVGFDWNPVNKQLYFSDNGRDWLSEDVPQDELNRVTKEGQDFGAPYCYQGNLPDPEFGWGHSCSEFVPPIMLTGPHAAGLGLRFYTGNMFPRKYKNAIFLARHGSWNRSKKFGGDVLAVFLNRDGTVRSSEVFLSGFLENNSYIGRPVDIEFLRDGSMLLSDDWNGAIYHITYGKAHTASR